ncbi:MAG: hypothetical protein O3C21_07330 [Verrucomicrobia bacterium]|nr:hypothetical protein [Verrucomicrobiota bacterium]
MNITQISDSLGNCVHRCRPFVFFCCVLLLAGCGGDDGETPAAKTSDEAAATPVGQPAEAPSSDPLPSPTSEPDLPDPDPSTGAATEPDAATPPPPLPPAAVSPAPPEPETVAEPKLRPRIKSPIDKLPPPENEMTPPPPRNSMAAAELASKKSEEAGAAYMAFLDAKSTDERIKYIRRGSEIKSKVEEYHTTHVQRDFKVTETQIMGAGRRLDDPTKFVFPYYVATTKNPYGFLLMIYEEEDGMKLSWEQFVLGQDYPMQEFLERKDTEPYEFLGAITQAHIFDPDFSESEKEKLIAVNIDLPRVAFADKPVAHVDRASPIGKQLEEALPWGKRQLSRVSLIHDANGKVFITRYAKLAHPN